MAKFTLTYNAKSKNDPVSLTYESNGSLVNTSTQQNNIKAKFTKTYNIKPNANRNITTLKIKIRQYIEHFNDQFVSDYEVNLLAEVLLKEDQEVIKLTLKNFMKKGLLRGQVDVAKISVTSDRTAVPKRQGYHYTGDIKFEEY